MKQEGKPCWAKSLAATFTSKKRSSSLSWDLRPQESDSCIYRFLPITLLQLGSRLPGDAALRTKVPSGKPLSRPFPVLALPPQTPKWGSSLGVQRSYITQLYSGRDMPFFQPLETRPSNSWAHQSYSVHLHSISLASCSRSILPPTPVPFSSPLSWTFPCYVHDKDKPESASTSIMVWQWGWKMNSILTHHHKIGNVCREVRPIYGGLWSVTD